MHGNLRQNGEFTHSLLPAARTANAAGAEVSLVKGTEHAVLFDVGAWTDGVHTFTIYEAPDVAGAAGAFTQVAAKHLDAEDNVLEADGTLVIDAANEDDRIVVVTYTGGKDHLRIDVGVAGAPATGLVSSVMVITTALRYVGNNPAIPVGGTAPHW